MELESEGDLMQYLVDAMGYCLKMHRAGAYLASVMFCSFM
jgi:hypothetical protein